MEASKKITDEQDLAARADSAHLHALIHGQDTRNLAQSLEQVSHHTGALKRMISPLSLMEPVGAGQEHHDIEQKNQSKVGSFAGALASALINHMLMFGMCCSYGMIIFSEQRNAAHRALGVKMCLAASFIGGGLMSVFSGIPVAIGGTDLNPAVFYGDWVITISDDLTRQLGLEDSASYTDSSGRLLKKEDPTKYFCRGDHLLAYPQECESYHAQLRATIIFSVAFSTLLLAIVWTVLGKLKLTRYVSYMPYSISEAFLACVGYKVFYYALKFCDFDPRQFFTAAFIGIALYFCKALHIGNPTIMMPLGLLLPLAIFWGIVAGTNQTPATVRDAGWLFPEVQNEPFYLVWVDSLGSLSNINFSAWVTTLPNLAVFMVVSTMDCVLKLHATESKLPLKVSTDSEAFIFGLFNYLLACCGAATGYMQLKFNVISYGVMRNAHDRRAGMIYAVFCGAAYFSTVEHFNYLPKLFLSALLFFAGAGFVTDNMWGSRKFLHFSEWMEIVVVLIVFIAAGQLIWAVVAGLVLSGLAFIAKYARVPSLDGRPKRGDQVTTRERPVGEVGHQSFMHIASAWILIVNLKGYVFFSSCVAVMRSVEEYFQQEDKNQVPPYRRLKFLLFDGSALDGMDASGAMSMAKLTRKAKGRGVRVIWCNIKDDLAEELRVRSILASKEDRFEDLDNAMTHLEKRILKYKMNQQDEWLNLHPAFRRDRALMLQRVNFEPFREVFLSDGARLGCPWRYCSRLPIKGFKTMLCVPGDVHRPLYLIHSGAVAILDEVPDLDSITDAHASWKKPRVILRQGWFVNEKTIFGQPSSSFALAVEDGEVLFWTEEQWWKMTNEHPLMMMEISKAVMRQQGEHHFHRQPEKNRRPSELSMEDIDTDVLMRREVSPSDVQPTEVEDSEEEELMIPSETPEDLPPTTYTSNASIGSYQYNGVTRFNKSVLCSPIDLGEAFERDELKRLPQLQTRIMELHFARALGEQGFFRSAGDADYLPDLPKMLIEDLRLAYFTFAEKGDDMQGKIILPASRVIDALLYVGIFHILTEEVNQKDLTLEEFLKLGRECHLARIHPEQMQKIEELCQSHEHMVHGEMQLLVADVSHMLKMLLGIYLDFAINDAVTSAWGQETWPDTHVTHKQFAGIVAFYVKRRERDWKLLQGVFDLMGKDTLSGSLNKDLLEDCRKRHSDDTGQDTTPHEEMLWAADWIRRGEGKGTHLDTCSLLTVFLTNLQRGKGRLPPKCSFTEQEVRPKRAWDRHTQRAFKKKASALTQFQSSQKIVPFQGQSSYEEGPAWARTIINIFERPSTSKCAAFVVYTMLTLTVLNVVAIVAEPMISGLDDDQPPDEHTFWLGCDIFFAAIFTIELILRIVARLAFDFSMSTVLRFFSNPFNIFDLVAVTEIYLDHLIHLPVLRLLILERFARLSRVMKLCRLKDFGCPMVAPLTAVLVVIMGTYMLHLEEVIS
ncbi:unnamed protein product [Symbiodinium microadriaticum]|nr:unnamed protein product [Symbiodinium microadriaticum]CAE7946613.1 unnamed protein product [Symbiodinium sp. KB8]